jgi:hypothetical protein
MIELIWGSCIYWFFKNNLIKFLQYLKPQIKATIVTAATAHL